MGDHIEVVIRCKPSAEEKAWRFDDNSLLYLDEDTPEVSSFTFQHIFGENTTHSQLYDAVVSPHVGKILQGSSSNFSVLAYGLPSSGKSHTIFGTSGQTRINKEARGLILRCGEQLLSELRKSHHSESICRVTATFCQVFGDGRTADLFDTKKRNLVIIESDGSTLSYHVNDLTEHVITSSQQLLRLLEKGYLMRNATGCSREPIKKLGIVTSGGVQPYRPHISHACFTFTIEYQRKRRSEVTVSRIMFVDLAGVGIRQLHSGMPPNSDSGIDTFHDVLASLPEGGVAKASRHYPRSSLTKILRQSIGGNGHTILIGNVCLSESLAPLTSKCLQVLSNSQRVPNFIKIECVPLEQSNLGKCLQEAERVKSGILQKLEISGSMDEIRVVSESECMISGASYDSVSSSTQELLMKLAAVESQLMRNGKPMQKELPNSSVRTSVEPQAMVRPSLPLNKPPPAPKLNINLLSSSVKVPAVHRPSNSSGTTQPDSTQANIAKKAEQKNIEQKALPKKDEEEEEASDSSLSLEDSDSSSDEEPAAASTPVISGPLPPPLKDIPHIKPDSPVTSQEFSYPTAHAQNTVTKRPLSAPRNYHGNTVPPAPISVLPRQPTNVQPLPLYAQKPPLPRPPVATQAFPHSSSPIHPTANGVIDMIQDNAHSPIISTNSFLVPVQTSTPKAKRNLFPDPASLISETQNSDNSLSAATPHEDLINHPQSQPQAILVSPAAQLIQKPPTTILSSTPSPDSQQPQQPRGVSTNMESQSIGSSSEHMSSSSESLTLSDSDADLTEEARDTFDPRMQQRRLHLQPVAQSMLGAARVSQLSVLPPIPSSAARANLPSPSGGGGGGSSLPPIRGPGTLAHNLTMTEQYPMSRSSLHRLKPLDKPQPPSYQEANTRRVTGSMGQGSGYYHGDGRDRLESQSEMTSEVNVTQYMSNEEIHTSAMEGVRSSQMKTLALQFGVDYRDHGGRTPLMYAVLGNQPKMCEVLIKLKADVNAKDYTVGFTPLLWATYQAKPAIMKTLLQNGADIQFRDNAGRSVYHWAMKTPNIQCLKWLCKYANSPFLVNQPDNEGLSPLHWAVMSNQASHIRLLLSSTSADVSLQDKEGRTPLNYAVLNFSPSCIRAILDRYKSAVNLIDAKGRVALHYACAEGSADCVRTLLSYQSCDLHCTDNKDTTPLHWAAAANQPGLVQLLIRRGADRGHRDSNDKTPLDYAQERGHTDCVKILQSYGLRRPSSAVSVASHTSLAATPTDPPSLDEHGHIVLKRPGRKFSLSGESMTSFSDCRNQPDNQAQSDDQPDSNERGSGTPREEEGERGGVAETRRSSVWSGDANEWAVLSRQPGHQSTSARRRWFSVLFGSCAGGRRNTVAPATTT